jgi:hypothetical protein
MNKAAQMNPLKIYYVQVTIFVARYAGTYILLYCVFIYISVNFEKGFANYFFLNIFKITTLVPGERVWRSQGGWRVVRSLEEGARECHVVQGSIS